NLTFSYKERQVLKKLSFTLNSSEIIALVGPSGAGKTTLLKILSNLLIKESGTLSFIDKENISSNISYMPHENLLLPWRTVLENVLLPTEFGNHKNDLKNEAIYFLSLFELESKIDKFPHEISSGMQK